MAYDHRISDGTVEETVAIDGAWMNSMRRRFIDASDGPSHREHLIYRVYPALRKQNNNAYEPIAVSIGPYHRGKKHLSTMEAHKQRYLRHLLNRNSDVSLERLVILMKAREEQVRGCYSEKIKLKSNPFVEMLLLDGCFIVELLSKLGREDDDLFVGPSWRFGYILDDLLLLENQLPFFILQDIVQIVDPNQDRSAFVKRSLEVVKLYSTMAKKDQCLLLNDDSIHHLLHLLHAHLKPNPTPPHEKSEILLQRSSLPCFRTSGCWTRETSLTIGKRMWIPSATSLREVGIKFKDGGKNALDIKFSKGVLEIPYIEVQDTTERELRNLIAFEQCCLSTSQFYVTSYVKFMDLIINTSKDVEILHKNGILAHGLGDDDEVAHLFNNLCKEIGVDHKENHICHTVRMVNEYRNVKIHKWRAMLVRDYFYSPWAVLSFTVAVCILCFTGTQTIFSVLSYIRQRHP